jgi:hypothetical protein
MRHLSEEEVLGLLTEGGEPPEHLEECAACRASLKELAAFVGAASEPAGPLPDWEAQRQAIMARAQRPRTGRGLRVALPLAAGLLLALGVSYQAGVFSPRPQPAPVRLTQTAEPEQGFALLEPEGEEFDNFVEFMVPTEEDGNETDGVGVHSGLGTPGGGFA